MAMAVPTSEYLVTKRNIFDNRPNPIWVTALSSSGYFGALHTAQQCLDVRQGSGEHIIPDGSYYIDAPIDPKSLQVAGCSLQYEYIGITANAKELKS
jgi:hypothetical protein